LETYTYKFSYEISSVVEPERHNMIERPAVMYACHVSGG